MFMQLLTNYVQAQFKDRVLRESVGEFQGGTGTNEQQSLVCGLDHDVNVMRTSLYNGLSQRILRVSCVNIGFEIWCSKKYL